MFLKKTLSVSSFWWVAISLTFSTASSTLLIPSIFSWNKLNWINSWLTFFQTHPILLIGIGSMYLKSWKVHIGTYYYLLTSQKYVTVIQKEIVTFGSICLRQCGMQLGRKWFTGSFSWLTRYLASSSGFHKILFNRVLEALTKPDPKDDK